jgi:hypothetical protein
MPEEEVMATWAPPTTAVEGAVYAQENLPEEEVRVVFVHSLVATWAALIAVTAQVMQPEEEVRVTVQPTLVTWAPPQTGPHSQQGGYSLLSLITRMMGRPLQWKRAVSTAVMKSQR